MSQRQIASMLVGATIVINAVIIWYLITEPASGDDASNG